MYKMQFSMPKRNAQNGCKKGAADFPFWNATYVDLVHFQYECFYIYIDDDVWKWWVDKFER